MSAAAWLRDRAESLFADDRRLPLLAYGALWAGVLIFVMLVIAPHPWAMQTSRIDGISAALRGLQSGEPLLVGRGLDGSLSPVGLSDDLGIYILAPMVGRLFGMTEAPDMVEALFLLFFVPTVVLAPLAFVRITGSKVGALFVPIGLVLVVRSWNSDIYWIAGWTIVTLIPAVMWVDRRWGRWALPALIAIAGLAGIASTIRAQVGLPVLIAILLALGFRAPWPARLRGGAAILAVVMFALTSSVVLSQITSYRDTHAAPSARAPAYASGHVVWHNAYIGLGFLPNDRGIWWSDGVSAAAVLERDPDAPFASRRYDRVLRTMTLDIVRDDPVDFVVLTAKKATVVVRWAAALLLALILILPWAWRRRRDVIQPLLLLSAPALLILAVPPLVTVPYRPYTFGWLGAVALIAVVVLSLAMARMLELLADGVSLRAQVRGALPRSALGRGAVAAAVAVTVAVAVGGIAVNREATDWLNTKLSAQQRSAP